MDNNASKASYIYAYKETDFVKCPYCQRKLFEVKERKGSSIEIKCKCKELVRITI